MHRMRTRCLVEGVEGEVRKSSIMRDAIEWPRPLRKLISNVHHAEGEDLPVSTSDQGKELALATLPWL